MVRILTIAFLLMGYVMAAQVLKESGDIAVTDVPTTGLTGDDHIH